MKKLILIFSSLLSVNGLFADDASMHKETSNANAQPPPFVSAAIISAPKERPKKPTKNALTNVVGIISNVNCKAKLINVTVINGKRYDVHFVGIDAVSRKKRPLQAACYQLLHDGLNVTFSGHDAGTGYITDAIIRF